MTTAARGGGRRPGRRARLSRDLIVSTALAADLGTLTMRELASRLEVSHSALYRWVRSREELLDLVSAVMVDRILPTAEPAADSWRRWLADLAWRMHDTFLATPGYAAHVARPHRHNPESYGLLRTRVISAFRLAGATPEMADQSWYVFGHSVVHWLAAQPMVPDPGSAPPRFDLFLDALLRGLPVRTPIEHAHPPGDRPPPG